MSVVNPHARGPLDEKTLVGLSEDAARRLVMLDSASFRISARTSPDGTRLPMILTRDYHIGRVNVDLDRLGHVVRAWRG